MAKDNTKGKDETRVNRHTKKNNKVELRGAIEELGSNVYCYGNKRQAEFYNKTTEGIADYVGQTYNKDMRKLVNDGVELSLIEPTEPEGTANTYKIKKYEKDLSRYYEKLDKYNEYKAKVFLVIKGQCSLSMKNKLESMDKYKVFEENDNVVELLKLIKELSHQTTEVKYQYWTLTTLLWRLMNMRQGENETMAAYHKRFKNMIEIVEGQWGKLYPDKIAAEEADYNVKDKKADVISKCNAQMLACMFMHGANKKLYKKCINELNNMYQSRKITCWLCQGEGHKANECPKRNEEQNDNTHKGSKFEKAKVKWTHSIK